MAFTRKFLETIGLEDEKIDQIIEEHTTTTDRMKREIEQYKADAKKLPEVQRELDAMKNKGDDGWKDRHDKVKKEFDDFKDSITAKEVRAAKEKAVRAYLESKNIKDGNLTIAMRGLSAEVDAAELDGEKLKDTRALDDLIAGDLAGLVTKGRTEFNWTAPVGSGPSSGLNSLNERINTMLRG